MENDSREKSKGVVAIELPAPTGWKKKLTPKKGGTPSRNDIVFISPSGEEIKTKKQLEHYLKSHPGGPSASEFYWGTGDTPRRSARLSEKSKATETLESQTPRKKQKKSGPKRGAKEKKEDSDEENETAEDTEAAAAGSEAIVDVAMEDANVEENSEGEVVDEEALADKVDGKEEKMKEGDIVSEEPLADKDVDTEQKTNEGDVSEKGLADKDNIKDTELSTKESIDGNIMDTSKNQDPCNESSAAKKEDADNESLSEAGLKENNEEAENKQAKPGASSLFPVSNEAACSGREAITSKDEISTAADAMIEKEFEDAKAGQEGNLDKKSPAKEVASAEVKPDNDNLNGNQEIGNGLENDLLSPQKSPHEP